MTKENWDAPLHPRIKLRLKDIEMFRKEIVQGLDDFKPACRRSRFHALCDAAALALTTPTKGE